MSIASQISRLQSAKASLKTAIENKGVTVPSSALIDTYDDYVAEISGGGGGGGTCYFRTDDPYTASTFGRQSIKSITIPSGVTSIEASAFDNYSSLSSVTIPNSVTSIGNNAFRTCSSLSSITIPSGVTSISENTFQSCSNLSSITIPSGVTSIGKSAFQGSGLENITIPSGVTSIGASVFLTCTHLSSVTLPSGLTSIGTYAFSSCSSLSSITIPSGVTSIGNNAFQGSGLETITIPSGVTTIGSGVFSGCTSLSSITIPSGVTSIGASAFRKCSNLSSVIIPSGVTSIEGNVFQDSGLETITLPSGVTSIGSAAFMGCNKLTSFTCLAINPPVLAYNALTISNNCPIYVPAESVDDYKAAPHWSAIKNRIQAIPSPSTQQWVSVSADSNIPSGTILDLRVNSATTIEEDYIITIEDDDASVMIGNLCSGEECTEYDCAEYECTKYDEETGECIEQGENCIQQGDCINSECTAHTKAWAWPDDSYNQGYYTESISPLTFDSDGYWYLNAATGMSGFESDGGNTAPFDLQVLMDV